MPRQRLVITISGFIGDAQAHDAGSACWPPLFVSLDRSPGFPARDPAAHPLQTAGVALIQPQFCNPMPSNSQFQSVSSLMQREAAAGRYAGVAVVAIADKVIYEESAGLRLKSANLPIARDTRFQLASTSKLFTVIAIAQLLEQDMVGLEDSLTHWLYWVLAVVLLHSRPD